MVSNENAPEREGGRQAQSKRVERTFDIIDIWMDQLRFI